MRRSPTSNPTRPARRCLTRTAGQIRDHRQSPRWNRSAISRLHCRRPSRSRSGPSIPCGEVLERHRGDGAGSIFKIFTTAAALDMGMDQRSTRRPAEVRREGPGQQQRPRLSTAGVVCEERRRLPQLHECHRRARAVTKYRVRQSDSAGRCPARGRYGGQVGFAVIRRARKGPSLRPQQQREPRGLHQAAEHRFLHTRPVRAQRARVVECRRDPGLWRDVVPAQPDRQDLRPRGPRGGRHLAGL